VRAAHLHDQVQRGQRAQARAARRGALGRPCSRAGRGGRALRLRSRRVLPLRRHRRARGAAVGRRARAGPLPWRIIAAAAAAVLAGQGLAHGPRRGQHIRRRLQRGEGGLHLQARAHAAQLRRGAQPRPAPYFKPRRPIARTGGADGEPAVLEGQQARLRRCARARQGARRVRRRPPQSPPFRRRRRRALHLRLAARRALHVRHREPGELRAAASNTQRPVRARRPRRQLQRERQALAGQALRAQHARGAARRADVARERHLGGVLERGALQRQRDGHGARDEQGARAAAAGARRPRRARARRQRQRPQALGEAGQAAQQRRVRGHGQAHQPHVACARGRAASHAAHPGSAAPHRTAAPGSAHQCGAADPWAAGGEAAQGREGRAALVAVR